MKLKHLVSVKTPWLVQHSQPTYTGAHKHQNPAKCLSQTQRTLLQLHKQIIADYKLLTMKMHSLLKLPKFILIHVLVGSVSCRNSGTTQNVHTAVISTNTNSRHRKIDAQTLINSQCLYLKCWTLTISNLTNKVDRPYSSHKPELILINML